MTKPVSQSEPDVPAWVAWPVRAVAVAVVVPARLLWELVKVVARLVGQYLLVPIAWLLHHLVVRPLSWLAHYLIVVPLTWLGRLVWSWRHPVGRFLRRFVLRPVAWLLYHLLWRPLARLGRLVWSWRQGVGRFLLQYLVRPVGWLLYHLVRRPLAWLGRAVTPVLDALGRTVAAAWRGTGYALRAVGRGLAAVAVVVYRFVLRPFGQAAAWLWLHTVALLARGVAAAWRATVTPAARWLRRAVLGPAGRWVGDAVLRPAAATVRAVLITLGLRRAR
jgi:hypothetical protein